MAFVSLEDIAGTVECIVFPKVYEKYNELIAIDNKVFIRGRVSAGDEEDGKLIADTITLFEDVGRTLWLKFDDMDSYKAKQADIDLILKESDGRDTVTIYIANTRQKKELGRAMTVAGAEITGALKELIGEDNVKLV
jgi:DNA polymerase-3 subunit alpha